MYAVYNSIDRDAISQMGEWRDEYNVIEMIAVDQEDLSKLLTIESSEPCQGDTLLECLEIDNLELVWELLRN